MIPIVASKAQCPLVATALLVGTERDCSASKKKILEASWANS
jgi:hypothetical protein